MGLAFLYEAAVAHELAGGRFVCILACPHGGIGLPMGKVDPETRFCNEHVTLVGIMRANGPGRRWATQKE